MTVLKRTREAALRPRVMPPPKPAPKAFPAERVMDLRGNFRVWLEVQGRALVAHGWGGQRIEIPVSEIRRVVMASDYQLNGTSRVESLLILNQANQVLLRAPGKWQIYTEVRDVCEAAGLPNPTSDAGYRLDQTNSRLRPVRKRRSRYYSATYRKAPGYRRLRTSPLWRVPRLLMLFPLAAVVIMGLGIAGAAVFGGTLPGWFGDLRVLLGIVGALLGAAAGFWLCGLVSHAVADALRWAFASARVRRPGPLNRFFRRPGWPSWWTGAVSVFLWALVPAFIVFGPVIAAISGAHGLADSALVAQLRAQGTNTTGFLSDDHQVTVNSNGSEDVADVPVLRFHDQLRSAWTVTDPAIGGRPLPLNAADPESTHRPVTVVYLPGDPGTAAARQQLNGSVWHGAPTANVITGLMLTFLGLPLLAWRLITRYRRRWRTGADLLDHIAES